MFCKVCGRTISNENANFCEYCGSALNSRGESDIYENAGRESMNNGNSRYERNERSFQSNYANESGQYNSGSWQTNAGYNSYGRGTGYADNSLTGILAGTAGTAEAENSMSFLHWIVILLLPYIPIIGTFAYFVLLLVWAFGRTASITRKNWARASLVMLVVAIIFLSYTLSGILAGGGLENMMNSLGIS